MVRSWSSFSPVIAFICLLGPLAYVYGTDTRTGDARGGWPGEPRR